jgi:hypothetical protein
MGKDRFLHGSERCPLRMAKARTAAMLTTVYSMLSPHTKPTIVGPGRRIVQILSCAKKYNVEADSTDLFRRIDN